MAHFWKALDYVLQWEGGYSNNKADHGGATNYGITQTTLTRYVQTHKGTRVPENVSDILVKDAEEIYRALYWKFDNINDNAIATKIFDISVNMGLGAAVKMIQKIVGAVADGVMGPKTEDAINAGDPSILMSELVNACIKRYGEIILRDPTQEIFRKGWMRRAKSIPPG